MGFDTGHYSNKNNEAKFHLKECLAQIMLGLYYVYQKH